MNNPIQNPHARGVLDESSHGAGEVVAEFTITIHASGAMAVRGPIEQKEWALAVLANAADAVRNHHARREGGLIVPGKDVDVPRLA